MPKADAILTMMSAAHKTMMHKSFKSGFGIFCEMVGGGHFVGGGAWQDTKAGERTRLSRKEGRGSVPENIRTRGQALKYCDIDANSDPYKPPAANQLDIIATSFGVHFTDMIWGLYRQGVCLEEVLYL